MCVVKEVFSFEYIMFLNCVIQWVFGGRGGRKRISSVFSFGLKYKEKIVTHRTHTQDTHTTHNIYVCIYYHRQETRVCSVCEVCACVLFFFFFWELEKKLKCFDLPYLFSFFFTLVFFKETFLMIKKK